MRESKVWILGLRCSVLGQCGSAKQDILYQSDTTQGSVVKWNTVCIALVSLFVVDSSDLLGTMGDIIPTVS